MFATRPGSFAASSERTGDTNSPLATIASPLLVATAPVSPDAFVVVVTAALTACTSAGNGGASLVVVAATCGASFFAHAAAIVIRIRMAIRFISERLHSRFQW